MLQWLGIQPKAIYSEQLVSTIGGMVSLVCICLASYAMLGLGGALAVVPSMGAATVLLFAVPHGPLSQPWALFVGNIFSAAAGVTCALLIDNFILAAGAAVGLAIGIMHVFRCIHPPGGATALAAVVGGPAITDLGYYYLLTPVLLNCLIIFTTAVAFNALFPWRRYPLALMRYRPVAANTRSKVVLNAQDFEKAIQASGQLLNVTPKQIQSIYEVAHKLRLDGLSESFDFQLGGVYTNNLPGADWAVRKIIDHASHPDPASALIIYKVLDGAFKNTTNSCSRGDFAEWASVRLKPSEEPR